MPKGTELEARIREARGRYLASVPEKIRLLRSTVQAGDWATLATLAHRLAGSAGMYGLPGVRDPAVRLESLCHGSTDAEALHQGVEQLTTALHSAADSANAEIDDDLTH